MSFANKVVIVTGAGKGIGQAAAFQFAAAGARVALVDRSAEPGEQLAKQLAQDNQQAVFVRADISVEADVQAMVAEVVQRWGRLDILVNNAGSYLQGDVVQTSAEDWARIMGTNLTGAFLCMKYAVPAMPAGGVVVNVSSEAGLVGIKGQVAYNVSKAGMIALTRSSAVDLAERGIRVNCVCPGTTDTPLVRAACEQAPDPAAARRRLEEIRPLNRLGTPDEIAAAIVCMASDDLGYATGAVLSIDGGYTAQ